MRAERSDRLGFEGWTVTLAYDPKGYAYTRVRMVPPYRASWACMD